MELPLKSFSSHRRVRRSTRRRVDARYNAEIGFTDAITHPDPNIVTELGASYGPHTTSLGPLDRQPYYSCRPLSPWGSGG